MDFMRRIASGTLGGVGGTLVLTGFRQVLTATGLVGVTAPEQVIVRLEELGLLGDPSPEARRLLSAIAHLAYGVGPSGLGSELDRLVALYRGPPAAVERTNPEGAVADTGPRRLRRRLGFPEQGFEVGSGLGILA